MNSLERPVPQPESPRESSYETFSSIHHPAGLTVWAFRITGIMLLIGVLLNVSQLLQSKAAPSSFSFIIDFILAIGLFFLQPWAHGWTKFRAILGAIGYPIYLFTQYRPVTALIMSVIQLGFCGAMILLLTGRPQKWRIITSVAVFLIFFVGVQLVLYAMAYLVSLSASS
jgi:hypothetical protein